MHSRRVSLPRGAALSGFRSRRQLQPGPGIWNVGGMWIVGAGNDGGATGLPAPGASAHIHAELDRAYVVYHDCAFWLQCWSVNHLWASKRILTSPNSSASVGPDTV
jgi:hypothetical protein